MSCLLLTADGKVVPSLCPILPEKALVLCCFGREQTVMVSVSDVIGIELPPKIEIFLACLQLR